METYPRKAKARRNRRITAVLTDQEYLDVCDIRDRANVALRDVMLLGADQLKAELRKREVEFSDD